MRGIYGGESRRPLRDGGEFEVDGFPGFHPGLFSSAPSGSGVGVDWVCAIPTSPECAKDGTPGLYLKRGRSALTVIQ
jgi:hypothetical protein